MCRTTTTRYKSVDAVSSCLLAIAGTRDGAPAHALCVGELQKVFAGTLLYRCVWLSCAAVCATIESKRIVSTLLLRTLWFFASTTFRDFPYPAALCFRSCLCSLVFTFFVVCFDFNEFFDIVGIDAVCKLKVVLPGQFWSSCFVRTVSRFDFKCRLVLGAFYLIYYKKVNTQLTHSASFKKICRSKLGVAKWSLALECVGQNEKNVTAPNQIVGQSLSRASSRESDRNFRAV